MFIKNLSVFEPYISGINSSCSLLIRRWARLILLNLISVSDTFDYKKQLSYYLLHVIRRGHDLDDGPKWEKKELGSTTTSWHRSNFAEGAASLCLLSVLHSSPKWELQNSLCSFVEQKYYIKSMCLLPILPSSLCSWFSEEPNHFHLSRLYINEFLYHEYVYNTAMQTYTEQPERNCFRLEKQVEPWCQVE